MKTALRRSPFVALALTVTPAFTQDTTLRPSNTRPAEETVLRPTFEVSTTAETGS